MSNAQKVSLLDADRAMHQIWAEWFAFYDKHFRGPGIAISAADQMAFYEIAQPILQALRASPTPDAHSEVGVAPRLVSNLRVVLEEMTSQNADLGWQMALSELLVALEHPLTKHMPDRETLKNQILHDPDLENDAGAAKVDAHSEVGVKADMADALDDMADNLGLAKGYVVNLRTAAEMLRIGVVKAEPVVEIARLRAALEPFARATDVINIGYRVTEADLAEAKAALSSKSEGEL